jgi:hypothetical protein
MVPCCDCARPVELPEWSRALWVQLTAELRRQGEQPLDKSELARCAGCAAEHRAKIRVLYAAEHDQDVKDLAAVLGKIKHEKKLSDIDLQWAVKRGWSDLVRSALSKAQAGRGGAELSDPAPDKRCAD